METEPKVVVVDWKVDLLRMQDSSIFSFGALTYPMTENTKPEDMFILDPVVMHVETLKKLYAFLPGLIAALEQNAGQTRLS
jgi:hypothetical protein